MNTNRTIGFYITVLAAIVAAAGLICYSSAQNKLPIVNVLTAAAVVVVAALIILSRVMGFKSWMNLAAMLGAFLMAGALVQSFTTQLDALGYLVAGLYTMDQVIGFLRYAVLAAVSLLLFIIASFTDLNKA